MLKQMSTRNNSEEDWDSRSCLQADVFLLTGKARIKHAKTGKLQEVQVLLDTGADKSFVEKELADELELPILRTVDLVMYTFGAKEPKADKCDITSARIWDDQGEPIDLTLCKTDIISGRGKQVVLSKADVDYLEKCHIDLSDLQESTIRPKILLGCDQMWNLIKFPCEQHVLPSGLRVIPSRLGYLLTGRNALKGEKPSNTSCKLIESDRELSINPREEIEKWDQFWNGDAAGIDEFTGPMVTERAIVAKRVHEFFNETIEKREDGYYVRLPFKDNRDSLPNNYKLAHRRLVTVLQKLSEEPCLLKQYDEIFKDQLQKGMIEESINKERSASVVHYPPHQAQNLWRHDYSWDQTLSQPLQQQWEKLLQSFEQKFPRYIPTTANNQIVLFADASEIAMAICAYMVSQDSSHLLMAKSKLSPIKTRTTIPKLEMNALTMSARLTLSVLNA
ncbi:hypothetical protein ANCCEY_13358 [Ancylostoma ceylanicum]|uniref:Peptidase A2 domain-containing protein n=1 Tax=Ancylostoma ceylanicum TaxID=53326 RepID=A0A0D6LCH9_9BILA|nr:hypothetical protein ANCCEY_13358 [Ancylostoma ceylanicum]